MEGMTLKPKQNWFRRLFRRRARRTITVRNSCDVEMTVWLPPQRIYDGAVLPPGQAVIVTTNSVELLIELHADGIVVDFQTDGFMISPDGSDVRCSEKPTPPARPLQSRPSDRL